MKLNYSSDLTRLNVSESFACAKELEKYRQYLEKISKSKKYNVFESSIVLANDMSVRKVVQRCIRDTSSVKLRYIIVVGIGGSNLGTKAVYDALDGYADVLEGGRISKILFVDTLHEQWITRVCSVLASITDPQELLITIISKSGTTLETIAGAEIVIESMRHLKKLSERIVAITDRDSKLWRHATKKKWHTLEIPQKVGGRYSVLSAVGLFPLALAGYNIDSLCRGALEMREKCLDRSFLKNPALQSAIALFLSYKRGCVIHNTFLFSPQLESLGKWYRQLLGESIGKKESVGIVPIVSIGSTDLHSVGQLYLGGPKNIFTTFIRTTSRSNARVPAHGALSGLVKGIESRPASLIMDAVLDGTQAAYEKANLPFAENSFEGISEKELGAFFQWKMMEIMYLAALFNINAFDQPNVEAYKSESRRRLA